MENLLPNAFRTGTSWNSYLIESSSLDLDVTPLTIKKNLKHFSDDYTVSSKFTCDEDMICFELSLEDRPTKKKRGKAKETEELKTHIYKVAVSIEYWILFCNRILSNAIKEKFGEVFEAQSITALDLFGSPPYELLLFHVQAINCSKDFRMQVDSHALALQSEDKPPLKNRLVLLDLGCRSEHLPQIRKLTCSITNAKLEYSDEKERIKDVDMGVVELELEGRSLLDFYINLAENDNIQTVPKWIGACRESGKTHRKIVYS